MKYRWQIAVGALLWLQAAGQAGFVPKVEAVREGAAAAVKVNGLTALRLRAGNAGLSPYERASLVAARLQGWLSRGGGGLALKPQGETVWIVAGDLRLVAATPQEARRAGLPAASLAASWQKGLRAGLARPPLTADPGSVLIPLGETRQVRLGGVATGPVHLVLDLFNRSSEKAQVAILASPATISAGYRFISS